MASEGPNARRGGWLVLPLLAALGVGVGLLLALERGDEDADGAATTVAAREPASGGAGAAPAATDPRALPTAEPPPSESAVDWESAAVRTDGGTSASGEVLATMTEAEAEALRQLHGEGARSLRKGGGSGTVIGIGGRAGGSFGGRRGAVSGRAAQPHEGRVVDAATGAPVAGAEVFTMFTYDDGRAQRAYGVVTDADGSYGIRPSPRHGDRAELVVRAAGYVAQRVEFAQAPGTFELQQSGTSGWGTLRGRAQDEGGTGLAGMIFIDLRSEVGDRFTVSAWTDAAGRYRIEGLHPAAWQARLERDRPWADVTIPDGGEGLLDLVGRRADASPPAGPGSDRRVVRLTGPADGCVVRAEGGVDIYWLAPVKRGSARLELPFGIWVLRRHAPGAEPEVVRVEPGAGPLDVELTR